MKQRNGFVSNSSSSSFIIERKNLSDDQVKSIRNHIEYYNEHFSQLPGHYEQTDRDSWSIRIGEKSVSGYTYMDNFPMDELLERIGINEDDIEWDVGL